MLTRLARNIDLVVLDPEELLKVLEESHKVLRSLFLCGRFGSTRGQSRSDGLVDPQHVGQIHLSCFSCILLDISKLTYP